MSPFPHFYPKKKKSKSIAPWHKGTFAYLRQSAPLVRRLPHAFTLVELLIAVSIFSVVSIAVYSVFNSGASVMRRIKNIDLRQQKILLKSQRIIRELREQPACRKQLFSGTKDKINFAANVDYFPSRITYYFDDAKGALMRVSDKLDKIITEKGKLDTELKSKPQTFLSGVRGIKFEYLYLDLKKNEYVWVDDWTQEYLPLGVRFTITSENREYIFTCIFAYGVI